MSHSAPLEDRTLILYPLGGPRKAVEGCSTLLATWPPATWPPGDGEHQSPPEPVGPSHSGVWGQSPHYPEAIAQSHNAWNVGIKPSWALAFQGHFLAPPEPVADGDAAGPQEIPAGTGLGVQLSFSCPSWGVVGECEEGHHFAKELICNREWCRSCGGDGGKAHQRRKASWFPKARQLRVMGKFVVTIPPELRGRYREPRELAALGVSFKRMFQYHGFKRGLRRWHFFGEDHQAQGDGVPVYHPHLEAIVEAGRLSPAVLDAVKQSVANILGVDLARVNVHYQYGRSVVKKLHMVGYALRPTFEHWEWDEVLAYSLLGFRNALTWGKWDDLPAWDVPAGPSDGLVLEALEHGRCLLDGTPIRWGELVSARLLAAPWWESLGGGYWSWTGLARDGPVG